MELPQSQLALDPGVTKLHDSSTTTISLLDFLAGHLLAKRHHHRAFFQLRYGTAVLLVVRTTLRFARTASAILQPGLVEVVSHPCSHLASCLRKQDFALRANTAVPLRLIEECARWKPVLQVRTARHIFLPHGPQKIDLSPGHLLNILSRGVTAIGHHLLRLFLEPLL